MTSVRRDGTYDWTEDDDLDAAEVLRRFNELEPANATARAAVRETRSEPQQADTKEAGFRAIWSSSPTRTFAASSALLQSSTPRSAAALTSG